LVVGVWGGGGGKKTRYSSVKMQQHSGVKLKNRQATLAQKGMLVTALVKD